MTADNVAFVLSALAVGLIVGWIVARRVFTRRDDDDGDGGSL